MKVFTFKCRTGPDDGFHHRFEVLVESREEAARFLQTTERFRYVMTLSSKEEKEKILAALASPAVIEGPNLLDCSIFVDVDTLSLGSLASTQAS